MHLSVRYMSQRCCAVSVKIRVADFIFYLKRDDKDIVPYGLCVAVVV